jgi:rSAM/selenodomain-associated transferase 2
MKNGSVAEICSGGATAPQAKRLAAHREGASPRARELSIGIVVPVFNEAALLEAALERLRRVAGTFPIVVVDGSSTDGSAYTARHFFPTEIRPEANRGAQLNCGATLLGTGVLLFLHADSQLPEGFASSIRRALRHPRVVGGCFRLAFDSPRLMLRLYSWCTRFPGRFFHFGDQGFFVRREVFARMGGFRELPFLEDVDFLRRLGRYGQFTVLPTPVVTSARRFLRRGIVRQQLRNVLLVMLFELGVPADRLARFYPHDR